MENPTNKAEKRSIRRNYNDGEKQCKTNASNESSIIQNFNNLGPGESKIFISQSFCVCYRIQ